MYSQKMLSNIFQTIIYIKYFIIIYIQVVLKYIYIFTPNINIL